MKYLTIVIALTIAFASTREASALSEFKKEFEKKYAGEISKNKKLKSALKSARCELCHIRKPKGYSGKVGREFQNEYGMLLNKLIEGSAKDRKTKAKKAGSDAYTKEKAKLIEEFKKAMDKVAAMKSQGGKGPTYGDLIVKEGKIPVAVDVASAQFLESLRKKKEAAAKTEAKTEEATVE